MRIEIKDSTIVLLLTIVAIVILGLSISVLAQAVSGWFILCLIPTLYLSIFGINYSYELAKKEINK